MKVSLNVGLYWCGDKIRRGIFIHKEFVIELVGRGLQNGMFETVRGCQAKVDPIWGTKM